MRIRGLSIVGVALFSLTALAACSGGSSDETPTPRPTDAPETAAVVTPQPVEPTPTATATAPTATAPPTSTEALASPSEAALTQTQVFKGFGFSIAYPEGWTGETRDNLTAINELEEDHENLFASGGDSRVERKGKVVSLQYVGIDFFHNAGLPDQPSLEDLLEINGMLIGWQVLEKSDTFIFGVPAMAVSTKTPSTWGNAVMGFVNDKVFLLWLDAPTEEARDEFLPVWARMLESIEPMTEAPLSAEELYFQQVKKAQDLAGAKFGPFGALFRQAHQTRQNLIDALLEAGVGTAFTATVEALERIDPPDQFRTEHGALLSNYRELLRLDGQARQAVKDGDMARFVLINGQLGAVSAGFIVSLPPGFCNSLLGQQGGPECAPLEPLPAGAYGMQLNEALRMFEPKAAEVLGALGFLLSLSSEEYVVVYNEVLPKAAAMVSELDAQVSALTPPAELSADHDRLVLYFDELLDVVNEAVAAAAAGDLESIRMGLLPRIDMVTCEARKSLSAAEFKTLVVVHFGEMGPDECGGPF